MKVRNTLILEVMDSDESAERIQHKISKINDRYAELITIAARTQPDDGGSKPVLLGERTRIALLVIAIICTAAVLIAVVVATHLVLRKKTAICRIATVNIPSGYR